MSPAIGHPPTHSSASSSSPLSLLRASSLELGAAAMSSSSALAKGKSAAASTSRFEAKGGGGRSSSLAAAATSSSSKANKRTTTRGKAVKKVYSLPGQKFDPPEEREPLRIFYESLSKQIPSSEMAQFWLMEHGLLSPEMAKKAYDRKQKRQQQIRSGTPVKSTTVNTKDKPQTWKKPITSHNVDSITKAKRRADYTYDDNDLIVKMKRPRA